MFAILLTLVLAEPPKFTVVPGFIVTAGKVQRVAPLKFVTHSHLCPRCGHEFWHDDSSFGKSADHRCPSCSYGPVWNVNRRVR